MRKRAPKIERDEDGPRPAEPRRRVPRPTLGPLKTGEIPGIRADPVRRPYATISLVVASLIGFLTLSFVTRGEVALRVLGDEQWRLASSAFIYDGAWYQLACLVPIGLFGWRLELRHGPLLVLLVFAAGGIGGNAAAIAVGEEFLLGAPGAAMALLVAWVLPDLFRERQDVDHDADLLGTFVMALVIACMPIATPYASVVSVAAGGFVGLLLGLLLSRAAVNRD